MIDYVAAPGRAVGDQSPSDLGNGSISASTTSAPAVLALATTLLATPSAPVLTAASDSGISSTDRLTNVALPTLTGTATPNSTIKLYNGSMPLSTGGYPVVGTAVTGSDGNYSITITTPLNQGTNDLYVSSSDSAGDTSLASISTYVTLDTLAPNAPYDVELTPGSDTGAYDFDNITSNAHPTFAGYADSNTTVVLFDGPTAIGTATTGSTVDFSITPATALSEGTNVLTFRATDAAGNVSSSTYSTVVLDTVAPAAPLNLTLSTLSDSGVQGDNVTDSSSPILTGTTDGNNSISVYDVTGGTVTLVSSPLSSSIPNNGTFSVTVNDALSDGTHVLEAVATDLAGNVSTASATYTLTVDTVAPTITSITTTPSSTGTATTGNIVRIALNTSIGVTLAANSLAPTLLLNDGLSAYYDATASTATSQVFDHQVVAGENDADVKIIGVSFAGGNFADYAGNGLPYPTFASFAGADTGVVINTQAAVTPVTPPILTGVITLAGASGATIFTTSQNGSNSVTTTATGNDVVNSRGTDTVQAGGGTNNVFASGAAATVTGGTGNLVFIAGFGDYTAGGGTGVDILYGGLGHNMLTGGKAAGSILVAGVGNVTLSGGAGSAALMFGSPGTSVFNGSVGGSDTMVGGVGANTYNMTNGDIAFGGVSGPDVFNTGSGTSLIVEGGEATTINLGSGVTTDFAGYDAGDTYVATKGQGGTANIIGFKANDQIKLGGGFTAADASSAVSRATTGSFGTTLHLSDGTTVNLFGVSITSAQVSVG